VTIKTAIFDLDGTLVRLPIDYRALYAKFRRIMGIKNVKPITETVAALDEPLRERVFEAWTKAEFTALSNMTIVKEGVKLYRHYSEVPKALVTMQGQKTAERILSVLDMSFHPVITREDSLDRATQITLALEKLGSKPKNAIMIGDRETDKTAAERIGCKFRMVAT